MQLIGFSLMKLTGSTVLPCDWELLEVGEPWGRASLGVSLWGPAGNPSPCFINGVSPNERTGSEGLERGQPWWPRGGGTIPEGTPGTVWGLGAGDGLRAVGTAVPVLGLSPSPSELGGAPVTAAPRSNGNFYEKVKSSGFSFFPLKRCFSPSSHHSRGICSPTVAFSMRLPLLSGLSREGSGAIPGMWAAASPAAHNGGASAGCPRWVVPIQVLLARQRPTGETPLSPEGRPRGAAG